MVPSGPPCTPCKLVHATVFRFCNRRGTAFCLLTPLRASMPRCRSDLHVQSGPPRLTSQPANATAFGACRMSAAFMPSCHSEHPSHAWWNCAQPNPHASDTGAIQAETSRGPAALASCNSQSQYHFWGLCVVSNWFSSGMLLFGIGYVLLVEYWFYLSPNMTAVGVGGELVGLAFAPLTYFKI